MTNHHLFFTSIAVVLSGFRACVSPAEAFAATTVWSPRCGSATAAGTTRHLASPSLPPPQPSSSALNLFPFSRSNRRDSEKKKIGGSGTPTSAAGSGGGGGSNGNPKKALQRRLSDDDDAETVDDDDAASSDTNSNSRGTYVDALVQLVSLRMRRVAFLSWWAQVILTAVSSVTLLFTRNVLNLDGANPANKALLPNYFLAGSSIGLSLGSIFWTWATRRLARRLLRKPTTRIRAANMLRKSIVVGVGLNLIGMAVALFGAEQIVGGLAIKVLTTSSSAQAVYQGAQAANLLQPLDILVVQANTNTLFSHFCSVVAYLFLGRSIGQLDPPSVEGDERPRGF